MTDAERIRELMLENLFAVFNERFPDFLFSAAGQVAVSDDLGLLAFNHGPPQQPPAVTGFDVALVRDGRIAVLHTLLS